ncbi:hypothetical protein LCGC14_3155550, partial [marine sediment metagenome]
LSRRKSKRRPTAVTGNLQIGSIKKSRSFIVKPTALGLLSAQRGGPFDAKTGVYLAYMMPGWRQKIVPNDQEN